MFKVAKSRLPAALEAKFAQFPVAIIDTHGKDLTVSGEPSRVGTPAPSTAGVPVPASSSSPVPVQTKKMEPKKINTKVVTVEATFQAPADDLFTLLTDEKRIPIWTRAPAQVNAHHFPVTTHFPDRMPETVDPSDRIRLLSFRRWCQG